MSSPIPSNVLDPDLYKKAREVIYKKYPKHSAYRSGQLVKYYRDTLNGRYSGKKTKGGLTRWFKEDWQDIGNREYPVYRPTKRISPDTPLTASEIDPKQAVSQIKLKQIIKGTSNLPAFKEGGVEKSFIEAKKAPLNNPIWKVSNPETAQKKLTEYLGKGAILYLSNRKNKKFFVLDPEGRKVHFGDINHEDFLKHGLLKRRISYLNRATNIRGDWKRNKYSPNNLAINILW